MTAFKRKAMVIAFGATLSCGSGEPDGGAGPGGTRRGDGGSCTSAPSDGGDAMPDANVGPSEGGACEAIAAAHPIEGAQHLPICSPLSYGTNPPSSGNHYPQWAEYRTYDRAIPRGFWVHSLEHGAVVITYRCPDGCAADVAAAQAFIDGLPADCGPMARRLILTPDPDLDVRFAASAWGFNLRANCFDHEAFSAFYREHYDHAPESICGGGVDPTDVCGPSPCP
jgi:Protein of unknown function (DUF3105)